MASIHALGEKHAWPLPLRSSQNHSHSPCIPKQSTQKMDPKMNVSSHIAQRHSSRDNVAASPDGILLRAKRLGRRQAEESNKTGKICSP